MILIIDLTDQEWQKKLNIFESTHMFNFQEKTKTNQFDSKGQGNFFFGYGTFLYFY